VKVAIHQPHYLPWLGYLAKWAAADLLVFLDTVQYEKNGWQNRNRIRTAGGAHWLTVPVHAHLGTPITDVAVDTTQPWRARHLRAIEHAYARAAYLATHHASLCALLDVDWTQLARLAVARRHRSTRRDLQGRRRRHLPRRRPRRQIYGRGTPQSGRHHGALPALRAPRICAATWRIRAVSVRRGPIIDSRR
jgi:hypothetical protein